MQPKDRLIFPLDVPNKAEAKKFIELLREEVGLFKVGLELFMAEGPAFLKYLADSRVDYFLDLKFHDIPATMMGAQARIMKGAKLATVHIDQGRKMRKTIEACKNGVKVLGVTILTHLGPDDLEAMGIAPEYARHPTKLVLLRAKLAQEAGCDGVVCAGTEARAVKNEFGKDFLVVCPAIRPLWAAVPGDDQRRITTPAEAIKAGADYIVVGRPIRMANKPKEAAREIVAEIAEALT
ncbi:MAG: orotidine-5'-phosphate decarboxylase [Deltaproteobacteria bacterium]|nr:orotidine-5'-phosphate decarboxylase [Deltaproteobacteria bacterium]MBI4794835.1 orotidine-5'-phosphate decarboxylase [Deltaproteobacteria bacterium]